MTQGSSEHRLDAAVVGGQAGLAIGYCLKQQGCNFVILDAGEQVGDVWRSRWASFRLLTSAALSILPGLS
jgi:putative flavoprotein involved in K+ transport